MRSYTSCNCGWCRSVPSKVKREHKDEAHRKMRRQSKEAIKKDKEAPNSICTGRKS